jgi:hypothetical protein
MTRKKHPGWVAGDRVRLMGTPSGLQLATPNGTVVAAHDEWEGYYIVRLDRPANYYCRGHDEPLSEIVDAGDNLRPLADPTP